MTAPVTDRNAKIDCDAIKKIRINLDMTQQDLADRAEISRPLISLVEHGHKGISFDNLSKIAGGLGVKVKALIVE